jgi:lipoic acid synthetase
MGLKHVVLTSVNRDDLPDQGAGHFAATITALRQAISHIAVEVLTPDFQGREDCLITVLAAAPAVFNHNLETVPRLYKQVRPGSKYQRSLTVLSNAKRLAPHIPTKSGIMLGLGEQKEEVEQVLRDLRDHHCDILTLGQYLRPSLTQLPVDRYIEVEEFAQLADFARTLGFKTVHAGPLVRSSYHAAKLVESMDTNKTCS